MVGLSCGKGLRGMRAILAMAAFLVPAMVLTSGAQAALLLESDLGTAGFSSDWSSPTLIPSGVDRIEGTGRQNSHDNLMFGALPRGTQSLVIEFSAPAAIDYGYAAGAVVLFDSEPFAHGWAGTRAGEIRLDYYTHEQSIMLDLSGSFEDQLYLALNFTHGASIDYAITALPGAGHDAAPAPVPLPSSGLMLGVLFGVLALLVAPRSRRAA